MNTTHVSIDKVKFPKFLAPHVDEKLVWLFKNHSNKTAWSNNKVGFPFTAFPTLLQALKHYNNRIGDETFICLYYDHIPIGIINMDIPKIMFICTKCKKEYLHKIPIVRKLVPLTKFQKFIKIFFKGAFEPSIYEGYLNKCECGCSDFTVHII